MIRLFDRWSLDAQLVLLEDGVDEAGLPPEVVLHGRPVPLPGGLIHPTERHGVDSVAREQLLRHGDDPRPGRHGVLANVLQRL